MVVLVAAALGYFYIQGSQPQVESGSLLEELEGGTDVGLSTVRLLEQIQTVQIDTSFFNEPSYRSLVDYSVAVPVLNTGRRPNPFAPL